MNLTRLPKSYKFVIGILSIISQINNSIEFDIYNGTTCGEGDKLGACKKIFECPSAIKAVEEGQGHLYERCDFTGTEEIICCPDFHADEPLKNKDGIPDDGRVGGSSKIKTIDSKSEKACQEYISNARLNLGVQITYGVNAILGEFPHMAQIGYDDPELEGLFQWKCGGSLIHPRFVLTAAHCIQNSNDPPKIVRFGFVDSVLLGETNVVDRHVQKYTSHPDHNGLSWVNDIALIELTQEITRNDNNVYPACLYQTNDDPKELIVTGWEYDETGSGDYPHQILQKSDVEPLDLRECAKSFERLVNITEQHICCLSPNTKADTCKGDSGGPLQRLSSEIKNVYTIVGVTSFGVGCGDGKTPDVYTRVSSHIKWIESIVWP